MSRDEFVWVEKYRPRTIEECILPTSIKKTFLDFLDKGEVPNLLLSGPPGCGKTTVAKALCNELGVDVYVINGSDEGRFLDTVRNNAKNFASTVSLSSSAKHKVIIIDEADNTTPDVQLALRAFTEEFVGNCRFILPVTIKTKSYLPSILDVPSSTSPSKEKTELNSPVSSSKDSNRSWIKKLLDMTQKFLRNSSTNTSQTGDEYSTKFKGIRSAVKLTQGSSQVFRM